MRLFRASSIALWVTLLPGQGWTLDENATVEPPRTQIKAYGKTCRNLLVTHRDDLDFRIGGGEALLVSLETLSQALNTLGANDDLKTLIQEVFKSARQINPQNFGLSQIFPPLADLLLALRRDSMSDRLAICVMGKDCRFHLEADGCIALYDGRISYPWGMMASLEADLESPDVINGYRKVNAFPTVFFAPNRAPVATDGALALSQYSDWFFHELLHFIDDEYWSSWVEANLKLKKKGRPTDRLFQKFARWNSKGQLFVAAEFYLIFTESRAYTLNRFFSGTMAAVIAQSDAEKQAALGVSVISALIEDRVNRVQADIETHAARVVFQQGNMSETYAYFGLPSTEADLAADPDAGKKFMALANGPQRLKIEMDRTIEASRRLGN